MTPETAFSSGYRITVPVGRRISKSDSILTVCHPRPAATSARALAREALELGRREAFVVTRECGLVEGDGHGEPQEVLRREEGIRHGEEPPFASRPNLGARDPTAVPDGLEHVSRYPALFEELADRGYTDEDLGKIAGGNVLRVMREAKRLRERR